MLTPGGARELRFLLHFQDDFCPLIQASVYTAELLSSVPRGTLGLLLGILSEIKIDFFESHHENVPFDSTSTWPLT